MNKQKSDKVAVNDFATAGSSRDDTEELFLEIPGTVSSNVDPSNLRLQNDTTVSSTDDSRPCHRSDIDTCAENSQAVEANCHIASPSDDDRFAEQSQRFDSDENDTAIKHSSPQCKLPRVPYVLRKQLLPQETPKSNDFSDPDHRTCCCTLSTDTNDSNHSEHCRNQVVASNTAFRKVSSKTSKFQPITRTGPVKRSRKSHGNFLSSRISSMDDVLSVISEESLSSADNKSHNGIHRMSLESSTSRMESTNKPSRSHRDSTGIMTAQLNDPWVRSPERNPSAEPSGAKDLNPRNSNISLNNPERRSDFTTSVTEPHSRHRFRTESQDELQNIAANDRQNRNRCSNRQLKSEYKNRQDERNDFDLLSRPSWCDAKFALSRIVQGKATGNKAALQVRAFLHHKLFWLGCKIQKNALVVLLLGILTLCACSIGLKLAHMETNIEKLWVETGGELEEELQYTKSAFSTSASSDPATISSGGYVDNTATGGNGYSYLMLIQTGENTISVDSLNLHKKAAIAATEVTVTMYNQTWGFSDVCFKEQVPMQFESGGIASYIFERLFPCFIITPLDCLWDGAKLLGPNPPIHIPLIASHLLWTNINPLDLLDKYVSTTSPSIQDTLKYYREVMIRAGITSGYTERWCLDPFDEECPQTAPNYESKEIPDLNALFTAGCSGFAENFMQWPLDLILGGIQRNSDGNVTKSQGLQTLFNLMGVNNMYEYHKGIKTGSDWSLQRAEAILQNWERQFAKKIYEIAEDENMTKNSSDKLYAFTATTTNDLLKEFSQISFPRLIGGCLLMMGYACLSLMKSRASRSQGAVGILGVLLVVLSVLGGLGICCVISISFNAASTQVLPFLLLGLGVDDMFLMAHHFGEISVLNHIPFKERTGECLKRVGVSVFLTSIAILSGFLFSLIIPMPALRAFALQAIIVTAFNLVAVLVIFPAILSIDLNRRKDNKLDILCCFDSSTANEVIDLHPNDEDMEECGHHHVAYYHSPIIMSAPAENQSHLPGQVYPEPAEATITMHHTIQAFANNSYVTVMKPSTRTTVTPPSALEQGSSFAYSGDNLPRTPPPEYSASTTQSREERIYPLTRPRVAFVNAAMSEASSTGYSTPVSGRSSGRTSRRGNGSGPPTNLTTPMESVRSSTHSLVSRRNRGRRPAWWRRCFGRGYTCLATLPKFTLSQLGEQYYAPLLLRNSVRIVVIVLFVGLLGVSVYGATLVRDGLDFSDILPRGTREHSAIVAQTKYFSFQNMYIVTKSFDYASNQENMQRLHDSIGGFSSYVMKNTDGTLIKFWLDYFRAWLQDLQSEFDEAWRREDVNNATWLSRASDKTVLAYKLLIQTGREDDPLDFGRIGCLPSSSPCDRVNIVRLVDDKGIIREDAFYNYLSAWVGNDPLTYSASQAQIRPAPSAWFHIRKQNEMYIKRSSAINFAQMPFYLNNMRETEDFVSVINKVRGLIKTIENETPVEAYPSGYPFLFWQQYITLRFWLLVSLACVIGAVFLVLSIVLINPWAGAIMALFLTMIAVELFGFMGLAGVKLSAVPAVILVASIGLGVAFTVHIVFAFITSCGTRKERSRYSIGHMLNPVADGAVSTLLGVIMLTVAEFDFIITYFFQVLVALIFLGLLNGLVLLPVVLSLIGPPSEVIPENGGSRLKTPTPPPSPSMDVDCDLHHPGCERYSSNSNFNDVSDPRYCYQRRPNPCSHHRHCRSRYSSRDDLHVCPQHHRCNHRRSGYRRAPSYQHRQRRPMRHSAQNDNTHQFHSSDYGHRSHLSRIDRNSSCQQSSFHDPPIPTSQRVEGVGQVFVYPHAEYVVYSAGATPPNENTDQHCETEVSQTEQAQQNQWTTAKEVNQVPTLTATSSLTVKVHSRRKPVVSFVDPPTSSRGYPPPPDPDDLLPYPPGFQDPDESATSQSIKGRFDISALNEKENSQNCGKKS